MSGFHVHLVLGKKSKCEEKEEGKTTSPAERLKCKRNTRTSKVQIKFLGGQGPIKFSFYFGKPVRVREEKVSTL